MTRTEARRLLQRSPDLAVGDRVPVSLGVATTSRLQRSPDLAVGDRVRQDNELVARLLASTEPRPRGRGSKVERRAQSLRLPASTEPRPRGRGSPARHEDARRAAQASTEPRPRGRGSAAIGTEADGRALLQRSPDLAVGDRTSGCWWSRSRRRCFNGVPTSRSGIGGPAGRGAHADPRFNGAPTSRSGIEPRRIPIRAANACFNGAPTSRSGIGSTRSRTTTAR